MEERLSVVVPVYNVKPYLKRCVDSILKQTLRFERIILVDDGSTDGSGEICDRYAREHSNITVIHQSNQGLSAARNAGIEASQSEWIAFVDADDYVDPAMYEVLLGEIARENADVAISGVWIEQETGERYDQYRAGKKFVWNREQALIEMNSYRYFDMSFCNKVFRRSLFAELRFPVGKLCEDFYLLHRIIDKANVVVYTSEPFYHYVQRAQSISRGKKINHAQLDASQAQLTFFRERHPKISYVAETACAFANMGVYNAYVRNEVPFPDGLKKQLQKTARQYLGSVLRNGHIPKIKKLQACVFVLCLPVYGEIVRHKQHR